MGLLEFMFGGGIIGIVVGILVGNLILKKMQD